MAASACSSLQNPPPRISAAARRRRHRCLPRGAAAAAAVVVTFCLLHRVHHDSSSSFFGGGSPSSSSFVHAVTPTSNAAAHSTPAAVTTAPFGLGSSTVQPSVTQRRRHRRSPSTLAAVAQNTADGIPIDPRRRFSRLFTGVPSTISSSSCSRVDLLTLRGGSSLGSGSSSSGSTWTAGSTFDRPGSGSRSFSTGSGSRPQQSYDSSSVGGRGQQQSYDSSSVGGRRTEGTETKGAISDAFLVREDRNRFIARVYAILSGQLLFTAWAIQAFQSNPQLRDWMLFSSAGRKVPMLGLILSTVAYCIAVSSERARHSSMKWLVLALFTAGESVAVGFISSLYAHDIVTKAMVTTATATLSVTAYTLLQKNPKRDLSQWGRALSGCAMAFLLYGFVHLLELVGILPSGFLPYGEAIYCLLGAGLFSLYLAHHTRLIVGGKSAKYQMNEKDYVLGAMSLYSDIINIFLYVLRLLGDLSDDK